VTNKENNPTIANPTLSELAWAAGILDGEGALCIPKKGRKPISYSCISISVSNTSLDMLTKLRALFGGYIYPRNDSRRLGRRDLWQWSISSRRARSCLFLVAEHMVAKKRLAEMLLEFAGTIRYGSARYTPVAQDVLDRRSSLVDMVRSINAGGGSGRKKSSVLDSSELRN
jgi:hypothetical protein